MAARDPLKMETLRALAAEIAGEKFGPDQLAAHMSVMEGALAAVDQLRALPLKEVEPAVVFRPVRRDGGA